MLFTINTPSGYVKTIRTIGGELNGIAEYTNDRNEARQFTKKRIAELRAKSYFRYYGIKITIEEI